MTGQPPKRRIIGPDTAIKNQIGFAQKFLDNDDFTELAINEPGTIWGYGRGWDNYGSEVSEVDLSDLCRSIATLSGGELSAANPILTAMLHTGERVHMTHPVVTKYHTLTIRKPSSHVFTPDQYLASGMFNVPGTANVDRDLDEMYAEAIKPKATAALRLQFCLAAVGAGKTTVVAGATGSGKTALLNMLISAIDRNARLLVCEDVQEIRYPNHANAVGLRFSSSGKIGDLSVTPTQALKSCMRMLPTRILFGELRDGDKATSEWLSACSSGHSGSLTTVHAGSAQECYARLIKMSRQSDDPLPYEAAREDVMAAVDLVIHIGFVDGERRITEIAYTP